MQWLIVGVFLIAGVAIAELEITQVKIDKLDDVHQLKTKCEKKNPGSYDRLKAAINESHTCLEGKLIFTKIEKELDIAKETGSMDEVFAKYCKKRPEYKDCIMKTVNVSRDCLEDAELTALDTAIKVIEEIADFACFNDGDRLAMFVAEGGIDCVKNRTDDIAKCINATLQINIDPTKDFSLASLPNAIPSIGIDKKKCDDLATIRQCVVSDLENNCKDTTPANIVDALFKFINKSTCKNLKQKRSSKVMRLKRDIQWPASKMMNFLAVQEKIAEKCKENGGREGINYYLLSLQNAQACFGKNKLFVAPKDEYLNALKNCTNNLVLSAEACLSEESKYLPSLIMEAVQSLIGFAYDHLNFKTLSPKSEIVHCLQRIKSIGIRNSFDSCIQFLSPPECSSFSIPNKSETCKQWLNINECFANFVKKTCIRDIAVDRFLANLTEASQKPCENP